MGVSTIINPATRKRNPQTQFPVLNSLLPSVHKSAGMAKISILKIEAIIKKISYECRDYESVDKKEPILGYIMKNDKKIQAVKHSYFGLYCQK